MYNMKDFDQLFEEFGKFFEDQYLNTAIGKNVLDRYIKFCDIKPRNIYTAKTDFRLRYINENHMINLTINHLCKTHELDRTEIIESIPEIREHYPFLEEIESFELPALQYKNPNFKFFMKEQLELFFKTVDQRQYGEYYTPEELIRLSFQHIEIGFDKSIVDPACGSGFFLLEYIELLYEKMELNPDNVELLKRNIAGFDIFPFAIIMTKFLLGEFLVKKFPDIEKAFLFPNIMVHNSVNSLKCKNPSNVNDFDLIIGNPPFFRIKPDDKNAICSCVSYGHNYIHSIFVHWSLQHLKKNGQACLFLPQSMLSGLYYKKLRESLLANSSLDLIITDRKHEESFMVQQDIMILYFSKTEVKKDFKIGIPDLIYNGISEIPLPLSITNNTNSVIPVFKSSEQKKSAERLSNHEILDIIEEFEISTGNFVWNQNKEFIFPESKEGTIPLIMGPSVTPDGIKVGQAKFNYCFPPETRYIKSDLSILFRRMSPIGNESRMVAAIIDNTETPFYVVENHVNIIKHKENDLIKTKRMLSFLLSDDFNLILDSFCQTNQVSTNDLLTIFESLKLYSWNGEKLIV